MLVIDILSLEFKLFFVVIIIAARERSIRDLFVTIGLDMDALSILARVISQYLIIVTNTI